MQPQRRQPTRLPCPWDSPGKNTGVGCHFLLQCMRVKSESEVTQLCSTPSNPMDCSLPGSSVHRIFQARVLEWGAIAFSVYIYIYIYVCVCVSDSFHLYVIIKYWVHSPELYSGFLLVMSFTYGQNTGASASASVLPMNIQGWFPLGIDWYMSIYVSSICPSQTSNLSLSPCPKSL